MEIPKGEWTLLKGASGWGKTTLLRILMGLEQADAGELIWDSREKNEKEHLQTGRNTSKMRINNRSAEHVRPIITTVFQEDRLCMNESAIRNVAMVLRSQATEIGEVILSHFSRVGLTDIEALHQPVSKLSGGMRRRVAIVRAVLAPGDMLLLDEPFQGLDEDTKKQVIQYMKEEQRDRTVVLVTHDEDGFDISKGCVTL